MTPRSRSGGAAALLLLAFLLAAAPAATALNGLTPAHDSTLSTFFDDTSTTPDALTALDGQFLGQDAAAFATGDLDAVLERERARIVQEHELRAEFQDVQEQCQDALDHLRAQFAQEQSPLERERLRDQRDALVEQCRERLQDIAQRMEALEARSVDVRVSEPRFERLIELTRERLAVQDRLEAVQDACAQLDAPTRECLREQALLQARLEAIGQEETILETHPQAAFFVDELRERRLQQQRAQEALVDLEDQVATLEARCDARQAALQADLAQADTLRERERLQLQMLRLQDACEQRRDALQEHQAHLQDELGALDLSTDGLAQDLLVDERDPRRDRTTLGNGLFGDDRSLFDRDRSLFDQPRGLFDRGFGSGFGVGGGIFG